VSNALRADPVTLAHIEILSVLHGRCFEEGWSPDSMASLLSTPGTLGVIAVNEKTDQPVGFILMRIVAGEGEILTVGVVPEAQAQGIGTFLLGIMLQEAVEAIFLDVASDNDPAMKLYQRAGFEVVGRRPGYYKRAGGGPIDSLTMKYVLG
jgi:[ribosomal protein S18]-alanine N-acetyltransferase